MFEHRQNNQNFSFVTSKIMQIEYERCCQMFRFFIRLCCVPKFLVDFSNQTIPSRRLEYYRMDPFPMMNWTLIISLKGRPIIFLQFPYFSEIPISRGECLLEFSVIEDLENLNYGNSQMFVVINVNF